MVIAATKSRPYGVFGCPHHRGENLRQGGRGFPALGRQHRGRPACARPASANAARIVIREMAHRSGNMFQLVQSLFNQTMGTSSNDPGAQSFRARLDSLARTNYLIAQDGWTQTRLRSLADTALAGFRDNIDMKGRDVLLPAALGFDLALVFHELATNSSKYGSLSNSGGRVSLAWRLETAGAATRLLIDWHDDGEGERPARAGGCPWHRFRPPPDPRALVEGANGAARSNRPRMTGFGYGCVWPCPPTSPTRWPNSQRQFCLPCDAMCLSSSQRGKEGGVMRPASGNCLLVILFVILPRSGVFAQDAAGASDHPTVPMAGDQITVIGASELEEALMRDGKVAIYGIQFDFEGADIQPQSAAQMEEIGQPAERQRGAARADCRSHRRPGRLLLQHAPGGPQRRAEAVVEALASSHGIASARLHPVGAGMVSPVATNWTEEGRARNRRVEIVELLGY